MNNKKTDYMSDIFFYQGTTNLLKDIKEKESIDESLSDLQLQEIRKRITEFFNIKNIHFLFGSGTSCNAIPNMKGLFKKVIMAIITSKNTSKEEAYKEIWQEFKAINKRIREKGNLEEILGILYSNRIYLENYIERKTEYERCVKLIDFIEQIIFNEINIDFKADKAKIVLPNYQRFYQKLAFRNKDLSRLNIFTTNNDLFNETALDSLNIHYINGFGGGINKFFNPALFSYIFSKRMDTSIEKYEPVENMVNLYKIHGSVNWIEDNSNVNTFFKIREVSYPEKLKAKKNILIYPTPTKQNKSLGSPYVELFREFQKKLLIPHSVLFVIGYSFSDEHVNNIIYQALATNSTINIVIINDVCNKEIAQISDNRIFRIWGNVDVDGDNKTIHYFDYIVNNLLPDVDATKNQDTILKQFIDYYNKKQPE